jgi:Spy/CpxP family protein refolding chaperone
MNSLTTSKVLAYLAIIFVAGGATGAVIALGNSRDRQAQPASIEKTCSRFQCRLISKVHLTPEQVTKLQPVFDRTAHELCAVRTRALKDTEDIIRKAHEEIAKELTPEQRARLEDLDRERLQREQPKR